MREDPLVTLAKRYPRTLLYLVSVNTLTLLLVLLEAIK